MKTSLTLGTLLLIGLLPTLGFAQNTNEEDLRQIKIKVETLEHAVYRNKGGMKSAPIHSNTTQLISRIDALEETLQDIIGRIEQLEHNSSHSTNNNYSAKPVTNNASVSNDYQAALSLVYSNKYSDAEIALKRFIGAYPKHELVENAYYWLGESHYARQQYEKASITFLNAYELFPSGNKTHDTLLKLGMALGHLGKKNEACITFDKLLNTMPKITISIKARAREEFSNLNCN